MSLDLLLLLDKLVAWVTLNSESAVVSNPFREVLEAAKKVYDETVELSAFAAWPTDLEFQERKSTHVPAIRQIKSWFNTHPLHRAVQSIADCAEWKQTYNEDEVGFGFLQDYGYIELYGPEGHYHSNQSRAYIGYWGRGLYYPWHHHEAEEIYTVISGSGYFESYGEDPALLTVGQTRRHYSNQPHALTMKESPILTLVLWRGAGMAKLPKMGHS